MTKRTRRLSACVFLLSLAMAAVGGASAQEFAVRIEPASGTKVSDVVLITARVTGADEVGIDKVEFSLNGELKATDQSIPYTFEWDTLSVDEGKYTLTAKAYDSRGQTASATVELVVDNELGKGAAYHADLALKGAGGHQVCRINLESASGMIDPTNLVAARALARIERRQGNLDRAIRILTEARIPDSDTAARADLIALKVAKAEAGGGFEALLEGISGAIAEAEKLAAARVAEAGTPLAKGDALFNALKFSDAVSQYQRDDSPASRARLLLAYHRAGRMRDAQVLRDLLAREQISNEAIRAANGYILFAEHQPAKARDAVQADVDAGYLPAILIAAYAELALNQRTKALELMQRAVDAAPDLAEAQLLRAIVTPDGIESQRALQKAIELNPLLPENYSVRGFQMLIGRDSRRYQRAETLFALALKLDPNCEHALMGMALTLLAAKRAADAEPYADKLAELDKSGPDSQMLVALVAFELDKGFKMKDALTRAFQLDPMQWSDPSPPTIADLIQRVNKYRFPAAFSANVFAAQARQ
mgnify:CR=1 FL=1